MIHKVKAGFNWDYFLPPNQDYSQHYGSCISYQRREQNDLYDQYGDGYSYTEQNTVIQQLWYDHENEQYKSLADQLNIGIKTISTIKQPPGNVITLHRDTFFKIKSKYPDEKRTLVRANIFLEDWKIGHIIQYKDLDGIWQTATHWKAGEGFLWDSSILHLSMNGGMKDKYTLQVSGYYERT